MNPLTLVIDSECIACMKKKERERELKRLQKYQDFFNIYCKVEKVDRDKDRTATISSEEWKRILADDELLDALVRLNRELFLSTLLKQYLRVYHLNIVGDNEEELSKAICTFDDTG